MQYGEQMRLRVRYVCEDYEGVYRADQSGGSNDRRTVLTFNGRYLAEIRDHGNGVHLEAERVSIDLDYSQLADIYRVIQAHHDCERKQTGCGIFETTTPPLFTRLKKKRKRKGKK